MPNLSNEFALDLTLNDVVDEAYDLLQVASDGEPTTGGLFNRAVRSLNIMLKLWESQGIHLWTFTEGHLFLQKDLDRLDFRLEGRDTGITPSTRAVHLSNDFEQLSTTADVAVNDLTIPVDSVTLLAIGDQFGVLNDDNDLEWFIVMGINALVVTLDRAVGVASSSSTIVYTYDYLNFSLLTDSTVSDSTVEVADTTLFSVDDQIAVLLDTNVTEERTISSIDQGLNELTVSAAFTGTASTGQACVNLTTRRNAFLPVKRITNDSVRRRESTDYEIPIVFQSRKDYFDLPNKNQSGSVIQAYYDRQQPQGVMYLWNRPAAARSIINFTYERPIMVLTDPTHTFDLPEEWLGAIIYNLAKRMIPKVGCSEARKTDIKDGATEYLDNALGFDQAVYGIRLKPMKYG